MSTATTPFRIWAQNMHGKLIGSSPQPKGVADHDLFAACELLASFIVRHLHSLQIGLCVFEACRRPRDNDKKALMRQNRAWIRGRILQDMILGVNEDFPGMATASLRWGTLLIVAPHYAVNHQAALMALWDNTKIAEKFCLLGGQVAVERWCCDVPDKEVAFHATAVCGRGTLCSQNVEPDEGVDAARNVTAKQILYARKKIAALRESRPSLEDFSACKPRSSIPGLVEGLQVKPSLIGKLKRDR